VKSATGPDMTAECSIWDRCVLYTMNAQTDRLLY